MEETVQHHPRMSGQASTGWLASGGASPTGAVRFQLSTRTGPLHLFGGWEVLFFLGVVISGYLTVEKSPVSRRPAPVDGRRAAHPGRAPARVVRTAGRADRARPQPRPRRLVVTEGPGAPTPPGSSLPWSLSGRPSPCAGGGPEALQRLAHRDLDRRAHPRAQLRQPCRSMAGTCWTTTSTVTNRLVGTDQYVYGPVFTQVMHAVTLVMGLDGARGSGHLGRGVRRSPPGGRGRGVLAAVAVGDRSASPRPGVGVWSRPLP